MKKLFLTLPLCLTLAACAERWSETGANGVRFQDAEPICRAEARASATRQLRFPFDRDSGPAGFPSDSRRDIERRETALCLQNQGFILSWE